MDSGRIYYQLIEKRKFFKLSDENYRERHHIIPKCMNGSDEESNLVYLSAREHYIAHWLLAKKHTGTPIGYKLASAFHYMQIDSHSNNRYITSRGYSAARELFSKNHPCKTEKIKDKIRVSTNLQKTDPIYVAKQKEGCAKYIASEQYKVMKSIRDEKTKINRQNKKKIDNEIVTVLCICGCGQHFEKTRISTKKYFSKSHEPKDWVTDEYREKLSKIKKQTLGKLTKEQKTQRSKNSFGTADQIKRGDAISHGKRGKLTNQKKLEQKKYGEMSENDFEIHISGRKDYIKKRMINRRKIYLYEQSNN